MLRDAHRSSSAYQILILDLHIPDLSGLDILKAIKSDGLSLKTIVLSGEEELSHVAPILQLGAYDYLRKPFEVEHLLRSVGNALGAHQLEIEVAKMHDDAEANAQLYGFLLNASPDLVYMLDEKGQFRFANQQMDRIFDAQYEAMHGQNWQDLFTQQSGLGTALQHQFDERRTGVRATIAEEFEYESDVGNRHALELSAIGLYEGSNSAEAGKFLGTYGVIRDITEVKRTQRQLSQSQRKFYSLFMDSPDAVFISQIDGGSIVESNPNFASMYAALGAQEVNNDQFLWTKEYTREHFVTGLNLHPTHHESTFAKTVHGEQHHFEIRARRIEIEGQQCMVATLRDRTQERRAEQDRLALQGQLQQAGRMEAIGQVAGGIAHDFNNILASIIGYAELVMNARSRLESTQVDQYLHEVVTAGHRARDLISQMLTFTKAQRGDVSPVDITATISDVSRMLRAAIPSSIEITTDFGSNLPLVLVDPVQIQQVIINLLINARDAINGNGRIGISVQCLSQSAVCRTCGEQFSGQHVVISVSDTGHGIPPELLERVFEMHFTTRAPDKGTGFGLWMINNLVHEHHGHISVSSTVDVGTDFRICLPLADRKEVPATVAPTAKPRIEGRIVVVDDEVSVANFIGEVLRDKGYPTVVFTESPKALDYLTSHIEDVALLLTDGSMPAISGIQLVEHVRRTKPDLPVIFVTAYTQTTDTKMLHKLGVETYLQKPFSIDEMMSAVARHTKADA